MCHRGKRSFVETDGDRLVAGRYRLTERIGRGGMGTVWLAEDGLLDRLVAVKKLRLPPQLEDDERARMLERTRREARSAARISHPNVIVVHDVVEDAGLPCIVMEYVPARSLSDVIKENGPLSPQAAARTALTMTAALRAAHEAGVLHRDVKPANVLMSDDGRRTVLTDFGIAAASGTATLTRTGEFVGSMAYTAPERFRGGDSSPAADVWALGATLYEAVEGRSPFQRDTWVETAYAAAGEPPHPMQRAGRLAPVLERLLSKDPADRPALDEAERLLRRTEEDSGPNAEQTERQRPRPAPPETTAGATAVRHTPASAPHAAGHQADTRSGAVPAGRPRRRRGARVLAWAAAALIVTGSAAAGGWWLARDDTARADSAPSVPGGNSSPSPGTSASPRPATPAGYHRVKDPLGFSVDVPDGWKRKQNAAGTDVDYISPSGRTGLKFSVLDFADTSPLRHWRQLEPEVRKLSPGYERLRMNATRYQGRPAALWEYKWQGRVRDYRAIDLGWGKAGERQYAVYLSAPEEAWAASKPFFDTATASFRATDN